MKKATSVSIIGRADGPTSIFIAGKSKDQPFKIKIKNQVNNLKRKRIARHIHPNAHSLKQVTALLKKEYGAKEISQKSRTYKEQRQSLKESLIITKKPELLKDLPPIQHPCSHNKKTIQKLHDQLNQRSEYISKIPDENIPMDFHIYQIHIPGGTMEIGIDFKWDIFGTSYSGNKKAMKKLKKISRKIHLYYGVSKDDIKNNTKRYSTLLTILTTD